MPAPQRQSTGLGWPLVGALYGLVVLTGSSSLHAEETDQASLDFFENRIRPVLVEKCYGCHDSGQDQPDGGLVLDRAGGWQVGGDAGPAIIPGDSAASLLMSAIRYESLEMPPDGKLSDEIVRDFARWIDAGAFDPRDEAMPDGLRRGEIDWDEAAKFWAFQPPRDSIPPGILSNGEKHDSIDAFVHEGLSRTGLEPAPAADPLVRLRRLAFDLTGLPPSPELMAAFRADPSESHWIRIVDGLLHSPDHAEHWARHWLDVVRYADSNGSDFNATFHDAWRYRDFVIRAFSEDLPFDQFVVRQIAGDLLPGDSPEQSADNLVATGFLMLGTKMLSERDKAKLEMDVVDDMIDTVGRALLGLTLGCARCHDHKFDPVPTEDYYALAGIFRSTQVLDGESQKYVSTWHKRPLPVAEERAEAVVRFEQQIQQLKAELTSAENELKGIEANKPLGQGSLVIDDSQAIAEGDWLQTTYSKPFHGVGYVHDQNRNKGQMKIRFPGPPRPGRYEVRIAYTAGGNRASNVPMTLDLGSAGGEPDADEDSNADRMRQFVVNQRTAPGISPFWHSLGEHLFGDPAEAGLEIRNDGTDGYVFADAVQYILVESDSAEPAVEEAAVQAWNEKFESAKRTVADAQVALDELQRTKPEPLPMAMAVRDASQIGDTCVCIRGEVDKPGPEVPRGFLRIAAVGPTEPVPTDQSGRLQLAQWITNPNHPLTARVIVNRVWMHLFGEGLVRTVDNFGVQGERPSHPELLDHLAVEFVRDGWSIRRLIRRLVMTRTYSQSSRYDEAAFQIDPDNRLLWRASRRRLPAESMRDTLVLATRTLDRTPSVAPMARFGTLVSQNVAAPTEVKVETTPRRSIYLPVIRGELPSLLVTFDFADPDLIVGRRESTNVPAQGLTLLNNPEVAQWCREIAVRLIQEEDDEAARLISAYHWLLQSDPPADEAEWILEFVAQGPDPVSAWAKAVQALVASTAFRFLD